MAVIGLYIAFVLPIILRYRARVRISSAGAWHTRQGLQVDHPLAILWIILICLLFLLPLFPDGIPGNGAVVGDHFLVNVNWIDFNYAPSGGEGAFLLSPGWRVLSANKWFRRPVRRWGLKRGWARIAGRCCRWLTGHLWCALNV